MKKLRKGNRTTETIAPILSLLLCLILVVFALSTTSKSYPDTTVGIVQWYDINAMSTWLIELKNKSNVMNMFIDCQSVDYYTYYHEEKDVITLSVNQLCGDWDVTYRKSLHMDYTNVKYRRSIWWK